MSSEGKEKIHVRYIPCFCMRTIYKAAFFATLLSLQNKSSPGKLLDQENGTAYYQASLLLFSYRHYSA